MTFNKLSLQRGDGLHLYKNFYIIHPKLRDIIDLQGIEGEDKYSTYLSMFITTSLDVADILWVEQKIWYEDIQSEWKFFIEKGFADAKEVYSYKVNEDGTRSIPSKTFLINKMLGESIGFFTNTSSEYIIDVDNNENITLINATKLDDNVYIYNENSFVFNQHFYEIGRRFLQKINWQGQQDHRVIHGGTRYAKKYILENEYKNRMDDIKKQRTSTVTLDSITSSLMCKGIPPSELWNLPIYLVYNLYYRFVQFENWNNTTHALYSGVLDTKKHPVNWEKINWSRVID